MPHAKLHPGTRVVASDRQVSADLAEESVILSMRDGQYYGLSGVGHLIWRRLAAPVSVAELAGAVAAEYDVDHDVAERDILRLLDDLVARGLAEIVPEGSEPDVAPRSS